MKTRRYSGLKDMRAIAFFFIIGFIGNLVTTTIKTNVEYLWYLRNLDKIQSQYYDIEKFLDNEIVPGFKGNYYLINFKAIDDTGGSQRLCLDEMEYFFSSKINQSLYYDFLLSFDLFTYEIINFFINTGADYQIFIQCKSPKRKLNGEIFDLIDSCSNQSCSRAEFVKNLIVEERFYYLKVPTILNSIDSLNTEVVQMIFFVK